MLEVLDIESEDSNVRREDMDNKAVKWLYGQLPELVEKGIIPPNSVELIQNYYGPVEEKGRHRTVLMIFSFIGAAMLGLGIILLLAHNWYQLSRLMRLGLSVGMLAGAQVLMGYILWREKTNLIWTEAAATFLIIMVGASMALVGQTYHLTDNFSTFMLTWLIMFLPVIYLTNASAAAVLYLAGVVIWSSAGYYDGSKQYIAWLLLAAVLPFYRYLLGQGRFTNRSVIVAWFLSVAVLINVGLFIGKHDIKIFTYSAFCALLFVIGSVWFDAKISLGRKPFKLIGLTGNILIIFILTFKDFWRWYFKRSPGDISSHEYIFVFVLLVLVIAIVLRYLKEKGITYLMFSAVPLIVGMGFMLQRSAIESSYIVMLLNLYMLVLSVSVINKGVKEGRLGILNAGMFMLALLVMVRFFDVGFSFVVRGFIFIIIGLCFLAANWVMFRRKRGGC